MFLLLLGLCYSESEPTFIPKKYSIKDPIANNETAGISIKFNESSNLLRKTYFKSAITIQNTYFQNNTAFGAHYAPGLGGAIYISECSLSFTNGTNYNNCSKNDASAGGCICAIGSIVLLKDINFSKNTAYKSAGTLYFQGCSNDDKLTILNCDFSENIAQTVGGAISMAHAKDVFIQGCSFCSNSAGLSGGAINSASADYLIFDRCRFFYNKLVSTQRNEMKLSENDIFKLANEIPRFRPRGGGAIFITSKTPKNNGTSNVDIFDSCFIGNSAGNHSTNLNAIDDKKYNHTANPGHSMMLYGDVYVYSVNTRLDYGESLVGMHGNVQLHSFGNDTCSSIEDDNFNIYDVKAFSIEYAKTDITTESSTSNIPSPSAFTYHATPITATINVVNKRTQIFTDHTTFIKAPIYVDTTFTQPPPVLDEKVNASLLSNQTITLTNITINATKATLTNTITETNTRTTISEKPKLTTTYTITQIITYIQFRTQILTYSAVFIIEPTPPDDQKKGEIFDAPTLIVISVICGLCILCVAMIGLYLYRKVRDKDLEEEEEDGDISFSEMSETPPPDLSTLRSQITDYGEGEAIEPQSDLNPSEIEDQNYINNSDF